MKEISRSLGVTEQTYCRWRKEGVRLGVERWEHTMIVRLPGPHDEVELLWPTLKAGLLENQDKKALAESLAGILRKKFLSRDGPDLTITEEQFEKVIHPPPTEMFIWHAAQTYLSAAVRPGSVDLKTASPIVQPTHHGAIADLLLTVFSSNHDTCVPSNALHRLVR